MEFLVGICYKGIAIFPLSLVLTAARGDIYILNGGKSVLYNFDGEKYKKASTHQKEWGNSIISEFNFTGNESILDLGCGDGILTERLAQSAPYGKTMGIDASAGMIQEARKREKPNLSFICMDINDLSFEDEFDIIYSNAALHWVKDHKKLLINCKKALKENGVIRWSFGGHGNCSNLNEVLIKTINAPKYKRLFIGFEWPWYMPTREEYLSLAESCDFSLFDVKLENADRYFPNSDEMIRWIDQPCIVPFLDFIKTNKEKMEFREDIINAMLEKSQCSNGKCFETFRRLNVIARK